MSTEEASYRPIKLLDKMEGKNHIVLLYYNEKKYADLVIARYLLNGLQKGESCIFFTSDKPETIEERLFAKGIDVDSYKGTNSLRIFCIERSGANRLDVLDTLKSIREEGMNLGLIVEKTGHEHFEEFDNSQLCYYDISEIEQSKRNEWIRGLLKTHHYVIYASEPDKAVAFETMLLEPED
jgi:hypothetical protein